MFQVRKNHPLQNEQSENARTTVRLSLNKVKRHKVSDDKLQIQTKQEIDNDLNERTTTSSKPKIEEVKQKTPVKSKKHAGHISKTQVFKLAKEEAKVAQDVQTSHFLMPYDIKKAIENDNSDSHSILNGIGFPSVSSFDKVVQCMKEISIASVKKIQNNIQRIKATEKKLKELERKASENLKKKSKSLTCALYLPEFIKI